VFGQSIEIVVPWANGDHSTKRIPVRWIGEQHVQEDCGRIPTVADWLRCIVPERWMNAPVKLARQLDAPVGARRDAG